MLYLQNFKKINIGNFQVSNINFTFIDTEVSIRVLSIKINLILLKRQPLINV